MGHNELDCFSVDHVNPLKPRLLFFLVFSCRLLAESLYVLYIVIFRMSSSEMPFIIVSCLTL